MIPRQALFDAPTPVRPSPDHSSPDRPAAAPPHPADPVDPTDDPRPLPPRHRVPTETFVATAFASRRTDGWTVERQRRFLEAIAEGHGVQDACRLVGLSVTSAYSFRRSARGAAFALGWRAAMLVARDTVADTLFVRAIHGQVDTYTRADGETVTRHRHDNRLGMALLARLDRQVEAAPDADIRAARLVAGEFDAFLHILADEGAAARAGLFLARREAGGEGAVAADLAAIHALARADRFVAAGAGLAGEVETADLDPAARAAWTAGQWARAEAAGLVVLAPPPPPEPEPAPEPAPAPQHPQHSAMGRDGEGAEPDRPVWWDDDRRAWVTSFPPPGDELDFDRWQEGDLGHVDYVRECTDEEVALMGGDPDRFTDEEMADQAAERDAWFADRRAAYVAAGLSPPAIVRRPTLFDALLAPAPASETPDRQAPDALAAAVPAAARSSPAPPAASPGAVELDLPPSTRPDGAPSFRDVLAFAEAADQDERDAGLGAGGAPPQGVGALGFPPPSSASPVPV